MQYSAYDVTVAQLNSLSRERFVETFGWIFEDSPWVGERAWARRPFASLEQLHTAMVEEVERAQPEEQLALLRAHPDLGARARMSEASVSEQAGAGLDRLTAAEYERLHGLNAAYRQKFGFPFLFAVKGSGKHDILNALESRLAAAPPEEFRRALAQVYRIALFRLQDAVQS